MSQDLRDRLFMSSIEIMENTHILQTEASLRQWGWLFKTYVQWYCFAYLLGELGIRDNSITVERAWRVVDWESKSADGILAKTPTSALGDVLNKLMIRAKRRKEMNAKIPIEGPKTLGINPNYMIPPPLKSMPQPPTEADLRRRDMFISQLNSAVSMAAPEPLMQSPVANTMPSPSTAVASGNSPNMYINSNNNLQNMNIPLTEMPWLMNNNGLSDTEMQGVDIPIDFNWDGWEDLVGAGGENMPMGGGAWW